MQIIFKELITLAISIFHREKGLVITGLLGFLIAAFSAVYLFFQGEVILPEGNMKNVFSFTAAIGIFLLSIAAILPFAFFSERKRKVIRWLFIIAILYGYMIETIQNFRGLNPRFSEVGGLVDTIAGALFGAVSLMLVVLGIILAVQFLKMKAPLARPVLIMGIRYALLSVFIANLGGIIMIILQDRFVGAEGNFIVLHGIGYHALQTLLLPAWLLEHSNQQQGRKRLLLHAGSIAWLASILFIAVQTGLGHSILELHLFSILASISLLIWLLTAVLSLVYWIRFIVKD
ncbi:hypothetical protein HUG15_07545 [Salicibibacter cibarius]|uniref:Uncharacterized protein n=1 Tax=Salicibibacter cibarius TaxID=2743000 RepID=A0A7T7CB02_9BACI|nr:hypothetical protein [Salicibibacter cibarius]QQK75449.1 hypothetical protein HUG15_07545 [Salicibibacter cibarius]